MITLIDGKSLAQEINQNTKNRVAELIASGIIPTLGVVLVGDNKASRTYIERKKEAAEAVGIAFKLFQFEEHIDEKTLIENIQKIQTSEDLSGLIIQLPLPEHLYTPHVLNSIDPSIDVDCLTHENLGKLFIKAEYVTPPTPQAVLTILQSLNIDLAGKDIAVVGVGALVGKPLTVMLMNERASVTTINSITRNVKEKCRTADIIVTGVGKKNILTKDMVNPHSVVIDTGFVYEDGKMMGDVDFEAVAPLVQAITPTPGGVGPITVAHLLENTAKCAEHKKFRP